MSTDLQVFDKLHANVKVFLEPIKTITVTDKSSNMVAMGALKTVSEFKKEIESKRKELVGPLNDRVKEINEYAKSIMEPITESEAYIKRVMGDFASAEKRRIEEEQRKIEAKAREEREKKEAEQRRQAEELRKKQEAEELKAREESEAKRKEEQARQETMALFGSEADDSKQAEIDAEEERKLAALKKKQDAERIAAEAKANREKIEADRRNAAAAKALQAERPKNIRKIWRWEAVSMADIPDQYWQLSDAAVTAAVARGERNIPGIRIFEEEIVVSGR